MTDLQHTIAQFLYLYTKHYYPLQLTPVQGGSINDAYRIVYGEHRFFCKVNDRDVFPQLFDKEAKALQYLQHTNTLKVPAVIDILYTESHQILMLEWIDTVTPTTVGWEKAGLQLAALHQCSHELFGWIDDNYMGSMTQRNRWETDFSTFFEEHRLVPQMKIAYDQELIGRQELLGLQRLFNQLPNIFGNPQPSLVHGDLWNGNIIFDRQGTPVLIDPAVYYGIPAVDLALTDLFGGFDKAFYDAYKTIHTLPWNYKEQWRVANLYPLLLHLNLFGKSYYSGIRETIQPFF